MYPKIRKSHWLLALSAALLAALLAATTAFAEGEVPLPETPQAEGPAAEAVVDATQEEPAPEPEAAPPVEEPAAEEPPAEEAVPEPAPEAVTAPAPEEAAATEIPLEEAALESAPEAETAPAPEEAALTEEIAQEPLSEIAAEAAESGVVLADESGGELPLTETSSAELLGSGDPYYTVGLTKYSFYAAFGACGTTLNCQDDLGPDVIQDALNYMDTTGLPSNRMLYVQGGTYDGFNINGISVPLLALLNGVIGEDGSENTFINGDIIVANNTGGFTLSGFTLNSGGHIYFGYNSGTLKLADLKIDGSIPTYALEASNHTGAIVLEGVNASNNAEFGAYIDNTIGSYPITIKNSAFNNNGWSDPSGVFGGLILASNSTITIDGVTANGNTGNGISIYDYTTLNIKNTFMVGNSCSINGLGYALYSYTDGSGSATLENVYAYGNDQGLALWGGSLNAKTIEASGSGEGNGLYFYSAIGGSRIEYGQFHGNYMDGLHIENKGAIYLNSVNSSDNGGAGAYLDNNQGSIFDFTGAGAVTITSPASGGWQLANGFFNNGDNGVNILSRGSVLISNADMGENGNIGLNVWNFYGLGSVTVNTTIPNWQNGFFNNYNEGITISSQGAVKLSRTSTEWNGRSGIDVYTKGTIELVNVNSANNLGFGALLDNQSAPLPRNVTLTNSSFDHNNSSGLFVFSHGSIIAYGLSASGNSIRDQFIYNATDTVTYHDLLGDGWVEDRYTIHGYIGEAMNLYLVSDDFDTYLDLYDPNGTLIASNNDSSGFTSNSYIGISLTATGDYTVVVKSYENNGSGEYWFSLNDEARNYIYTNPYDYYGAYLDNTSGNGAVAIYKPKDLNLLQGNFFNSNAGYGIQILSDGTITLDSAAAEYNFYEGVLLDNPASLASVTVSNSRTDDFYSSFSDNGSFGVLIKTRGNVTLKNIGAWGNAESGVYVNNCQYDFVNNVCQGFGSIQVLALADRSNDFGWNKVYGLEAYSKGAILLTNINAENNLYDGVYAFNGNDRSSGSVTVTTYGTHGWNTFIANGGYGLNAVSNGSIAVSKVDANDNASAGVWLDNRTSPTSAGILITRGYFIGNHEIGLEALSKGAITWRFGYARENSAAGAYLGNTDGTAAGITVLGSSTERMNFEENGWLSIPGYGGLLAYSNGKITLGYASAEHNFGDGFLLDNDSSTTNQMVDVTDVDANLNLWNGLYVESMGAITVKGISSEDNDIHGAYLFNNNAGALGNVTVTTTLARTKNDLWSNGERGLTIESRGSVYLTNISAWENGGNGIFVDNDEGTGNVTFLTTLRQYWLRDNGGSGLYIETKGSVVLNNQYGLNAHNNGGGFGGVYIYNLNGLPTSTVSLTRVFANNNYNESGITIYSKGKVTAVSTTAQNNAGGGLYIMSSTGGVTLSGSNYLTDNAGSGLTIQAPGAISISNLRAWANGNEGVYVYGFSANITLYNVIAAHNQFSGIVLISDGNYYLNKVTAFLNGETDFNYQYDDGLVIITDSATSTITILNSTFMNNWWGNGIDIIHPMADDLYTPFWPTLTNTSYMSNGETNLYVHYP